MQGRKYVSGLRKGLQTQSVPDPHIQVVFLLGSPPKVNLKNDEDLFRQINARFLTYNELVVNASTVYKDYLEKKGKLDPLRDVLAALSSPLMTNAITKTAQTAPSNSTKLKTPVSTSRIAKNQVLKKGINKGTLKKRR